MENRDAREPPSKQASRKMETGDRQGLHPTHKRDAASETTIDSVGNPERLHIGSIRRVVGLMACRLCYHPSNISIFSR